MILKNGGRSADFFNQKAACMTTFVRDIGFKDKPQFFNENWRKSPKIVII
jgi:hypothetical protein